MIDKEEACHPKLHGSKVARFRTRFHGREAVSGTYRARLLVSVVLAEDLALSIHTWYLLQPAAAACCLLVDSLNTGRQVDIKLPCKYLNAKI